VELDGRVWYVDNGGKKGEQKLDSCFFDAHTPTHTIVGP